MLLSWSVGFILFSLLLFTKADRQLETATLGETYKIQGNGGSILLVGHKGSDGSLGCIFVENTKIYRGIIKHMWAGTFKIVEMVSGHCQNSKNTDLCN
jgi:hypothetical protein